MDIDVSMSRSIRASDRVWQKHVITLRGQETIAQALDGQFKIEIPSVYIGYYPELEEKSPDEYPEYIRTITALPDSKKITDIIGKSVVDNKSLITIQIDNTGMDTPLKYNAIIVMIKNKSQEIIPYTISAIKIPEELPAQTQPTQIQLELLTLLSSEAEVTLTINPTLTATRVQFDKDGTGLNSINVQDAIKEVNNVLETKVGELTTKEQADRKSINTNRQEINRHKDAKITTEEGVHGFKYNKERKSIDYKDGEEWISIDLNSTDVKILLNVVKNKIDDNEQNINKENTTVTGGCYSPELHEYYINVIGGFYGNLY